MRITAEQIAAWKQEVPFKPFILVLVDDRHVVIDDPSRMKIPPKSGFIWVEASDGHMTLPLETIVCIQPKPTNQQIQSWIASREAEGGTAMTLEQIRTAHKREPFEPFLLYLADGRTLEVPHPEFLYIPPRGERCVFVSDDQGIVEAVDLLLVVSIKPMKPRGKQQHKKAG